MGKDLLGEHVEAWRGEWGGMPEFVQEDQTPARTLTVHLRDQAGLDAFLQLLDGKLYHDKWIWYPPRGYERWKTQRYTGGPPPRYPVYVISKGRWKTPLTANALERMGVPHHVVVEPQEREAYAAALGDARILVLPFSNLGRGSIPARNWVWEHAISQGAERHWILDDNMDGFYRLNRNVKRLVISGATFRAAEDFVDRYENVALAGMQYESFAMRRVLMPPFVVNTRIYSCILIRNDLPYRWRGRYNEDTDLSLRALKDGWCTVLFNAFLANKIATMRMGGGNTDELYRQDEDFDGRLEMARSLEEQHPDVVQVTWKWNRWQHHVDYTPFRRTRLRLRAGVEIPDGINEYGMELTEAP